MGREDLRKSWVGILNEVTSKTLTQGRLLSSEMNEEKFHLGIWEASSSKRKNE